MPRLARKNIKVFAGSATNNGVFGSLQANNPTITSDVEQIQSLTAWGEGWNAATETSEELPPLEEIQGVEYVTTYQQAYIMQEGVPEWAATVTYYKGSLAKEVTSTGFRIYNSLTDNNIGNLLSDTSNWKKVMDSDDLYAFDSTVVHDTGNETIAGVKTFSSSPLAPNPHWTDDSQKVATTHYIQNILQSLYPIGSIYIGTQSTCPLATLIPGSYWVLDGQGKALWGADDVRSAGNTISAGLPNITGKISSSTYLGIFNSTSSGAFIPDPGWGWNNGNEGAGQSACATEVNFSAASSNSIYGASDTVQPPAYVVNIWRRTA